MKAVTYQAPAEVQVVDVAAPKLNASGVAIVRPNSVSKGLRVGVGGRFGGETRRDVGGAPRRGGAWSS